MNRSLPQRSAPKQQRGIVMIVALIVLVGLTIASIGLLRAVDTTSAVTGNLAIKKDLYRQSNIGLQAALATLGPLRVGGALPQASNAGARYYATATEVAPDDRGLPQLLVDAPMPTVPGAPTGAWPGEFAVPIPTDAGTGITTSGGYLFRFVAERLCPNPGPADTTCRMAAGAGGNASDEAKADKTQGTVYIRLTWRVDGPKNSTSYFQAMVL